VGEGKVGFGVGVFDMVGDDEGEGLGPGESVGDCEGACSGDCTGIIEIGLLEGTVLLLGKFEVDGSFDSEGVKDGLNDSEDGSSERDGALDGEDGVGGGPPPPPAVTGAGVVEVMGGTVGANVTETGAICSGLSTQSYTTRSLSHRKVSVRRTFPTTKLVYSYVDRPPVNAVTMTTMSTL
jgi:hypothetical protein